MPPVNRNIFIYSDVKLEQNIPFPEKLSQFFEQYRGFGEESEVGQVAALFDLDLSIFQKYTEGDSAYQWLSLDDVIAVTKGFLECMRESPDYARAINYGGVPMETMRTEILKAKVRKDDTRIAELVKRWQNTPDSAFPPDTGYLTSNLLRIDLFHLEKILVQIQKAGGKKVYFVYR